MKLFTLFMKHSVLLLIKGIWLHESGVLWASPDGFVQGDPIIMKVHLRSKVTASPAISYFGGEMSIFSKSNVHIECLCKLERFFLGRCRH